MCCVNNNEEVLNIVKRMNTTPAMVEKPLFDTSSALAFANSIVDAKIFTLHQLEELTNYLRTYCTFEKPF